MTSVEVVTPSEWEKAAGRRLGTPSLVMVRSSLKPLGTAGAGFLGEHFMAEITVRERNCEAPQQILHFFVKSEPRGNEDQMELMAQTSCFSKEVTALSELFPLLRSALRDGGKGMEWTCECFFTRPDVIVLENLLHEGFVQVDVREPMDFGHCAAVLRALANLHSASLIFEETRSEQPCRLGDEYGDLLEESFFRHAPNHPGTAIMECGVKATLKTVELLRGREEARRIDTRLRQVAEFHFEGVKTSKRFRNTVCQGDLWKNNLFFLREAGGEAVAARLVDFQLVRYAPPATDVICFLYLSTTRSFRKNRLSEFYALYYDHLAQNLKRHGLDPERVFPQKQFRESCEFYKKLGPVIAVHYGNVVMFNPDDVNHVFASSADFQRFFLSDRSPEIEKAFGDDKFYREMITERIEELIEEVIEMENS